jgi:hypothetical protein
MSSPLCLKGMRFCQVARHCSEVYKKCSTDSTGSLLSCCHSRLANWWRNKLCYRKQRTDSRQRYRKRKIESCNNKDPLHVSRKKELNNDDVTYFKRARKLGGGWGVGWGGGLVKWIAEFVVFYISPIAALILMGLQWLLAITDFYESGLVFRYSQIRKTYTHPFVSGYLIRLMLITMLRNVKDGCT